MRIDRKAADNSHVGDESQEPKTRGEDKRRFQRFEIGMPVLVRLVVNEEAHALLRSQANATQRTALAKDISMTGMFFLSPVRFQNGDIVEIQLTLGARTYKVNALVVRSGIQKAPGREYFGCGVQFVKSPAIETVVPAIANYLRSRFKTIGAPGQTTKAA